MNRPPAPPRIEVWAPDGIGEIRSGDDVAAVVAEAISGDVVDGDIVVLTSKVVSKAEGRALPAADREQAITDQTVRLVATRALPDSTLRIVENPQGLVMAAAGVDASNTPEGTVLLLPVDPDASARRLRAELSRRLNVRLAVLVTDTAGRAWRDGVVDIAIGAAGLVVRDDLRGSVDAQGHVLTSTVVAVADEVAAASELVRGKSAGRPVAVVRGLERYVTDEDGPGARALQRPAGEDLFRLGSREAHQLGYDAGYRAGLDAGSTAARTGQGVADDAGPGVPGVPGVPGDGSGAVW